MPDSQVLLSVGIPTIAVLVGILINNRQIDGLRSEFRSEINSFRSETRERFSALERLMDSRFEAAHQGLLRVEGVVDAR